MSATLRGGLSVGGALTVAAMLTVGGAAAPAAADIIDDGASSLLWIDAAPVTIAAELQPGDRVYWSFTTGLSDATDGELWMTVRHSGELAAHPEGLRIEIRECSTAWVVPADAADEATCAGVATTALTDRAFAAIGADELWSLGALANDSERHFLATISFPDLAPSELQATSASFNIEFRAAGDTEGIGGGSGQPSPSIALTGVNPAAALALAAILLGAGGLIVAAARARFARTSEARS